MINHNQKSDRRVHRTRQLLIQSAREVLGEKGLNATTIQDITDRANVNRATFYAHFEDKYAISDIILRERIQSLLRNQLPPDCKWEKETLLHLIQAVIGLYSECRREGIIGELKEKATSDELSKFLIELLKQQIKEETPLSVPIETIAHVACWAILGAADQWSRDKKSISSEQMANNVLLILMGGITNLIPES